MIAIKKIEILIKLLLKQLQPLKATECFLKKSFENVLSSG